MHFLDPPDIKVISLMFQLTSYSSLRACEFNISLPLRKETVKTLHTQLISTSFPSSEIKTGPLDMTDWNLREPSKTRNTRDSAEIWAWSLNNKRRFSYFWMKAGYHRRHHVILWRTSLIIHVVHFVKSYLHILKHPREIIH